jgi:hypothetical protein
VVTCSIDQATTVDAILEWLRVLEQCDADDVDGPPQRSGGRHINHRRPVVGQNHRLLPASDCG